MNGNPYPAHGFGHLELTHVYTVTKADDDISPLSTGTAQERYSRHTPGDANQLDELFSRICTPREQRLASEVVWQQMRTERNLTVFDENGGDGANIRATAGDIKYKEPASEDVCAVPSEESIERSEEIEEGWKDSKQAKPSETDDCGKGKVLNDELNYDDLLDVAYFNSSNSTGSSIKKKRNTNGEDTKALLTEPLIDLTQPGPSFEPREPAKKPAPVLVDLTKSETFEKPAKKPAPVLVDLTKSETFEKPFPSSNNDPSLSSTNTRMYAVTTTTRESPSIDGEKLLSQKKHSSFAAGTITETHVSSGKIASASATNRLKGAPKREDITVTPSLANTTQVDNPSNLEGKRVSLTTVLSFPPNLEPPAGLPVLGIMSKPGVLNRHGFPSNWQVASVLGKCDGLKPGRNKPQRGGTTFRYRCCGLETRCRAGIVLMKPFLNDQLWEKHFLIYPDPTHAEGCEYHDQVYDLLPKNQYTTNY